MARTKQTPRRSTGGKAPATASSGVRKPYHRSRRSGKVDLRDSKYQSDETLDISFLRLLCQVVEETFGTDEVRMETGLILALQDAMLLNPTWQA